mmetsp:Transcript_74351/g.201104  ORF Transcript_74351/g.201104 Transcript_74351/m.201104 type:complete len:341 (+) Transcript_74351:257-1279(+)
MAPFMSWSWLCSFLRRVCSSSHFCVISSIIGWACLTFSSAASARLVADSTLAFSFATSCVLSSSRRWISDCSSRTLPALLFWASLTWSSSCVALSSASSLAERRLGTSSWRRRSCSCRACSAAAFSSVALSSSRARSSATRRASFSFARRPSTFSSSLSSPAFVLLSFASCAARSFSVWIASFSSELRFMCPSTSASSSAMREASADCSTSETALSVRSISSGAPCICARRSTMGSSRSDVASVLAGCWIPYCEYSIKTASRSPWSCTPIPTLCSTGAATTATGSCCCTCCICIGCCICICCATGADCTSCCSTGCCCTSSWCCCFSSSINEASSAAFAD